MESNGSGKKEEAESGTYAEDPLDSERLRNKRQRAAERSYTPEYEQPGRRPASAREDAFNSLAWMLEGATGLVDELRNSDLGLSEEFWLHAMASRREGLLALRAVLDELIEKSTEQTRKETERQKQRERRGGIDIDF